MTEYSSMASDLEMGVTPDLEMGVVVLLGMSLKSVYRADIVLLAIQE